MSLSSLLSIARTALLTHKRAMEVTAHNVANAQTPGYSRQRLQLHTLEPVRTPEGLIGRGVTAETVSRSRDQFYDAAFRRENGSFSRASTLRDGLSQVEDAIGEPSDVGLSASLDRMFHAFSDLANDPSSPAGRDQVVRAGDRLAKQLNQLDLRLATASSDAYSRLQGQTQQANELLKRIADLNRNILASGGDAAVDLQDSRDNAIDALSELMTVNVFRHDDGTVSVVGDGASLVDRVNATTLSLTGSGSAIALVDAGGATLGSVGGSMGGALEFIDRSVPGIKAQLDQLASSLVAQVNAVHRRGYTAAGATNTDFFDPSRITAGAIKLTDAILNSSAAVAAGGTNLTGDGTVALQLSQLGSTTVAALGGRTFRDYFSGLAAGVGQSVQGASADADVQQSLVDQADQRRTAVSGVSVDEEMVNLMSQQQAYGAAAKIITIAEEMMKVLLDTI